MNFILFFTYLLAITALIATPGPNVLLMVTHSIQYGKKAAAANAVGSACASALLIMLALYGIKKAIPNEFMPIFACVGACYLAFIGFRNITANSGIKNDLPNNQSFFIESFLTGLSNPKDILFFVLFLPHFIDDLIDFNHAVLLLTSGWVLCDLLILSTYGLLASKAGHFFSSAVLNKITKAIGYIILLIGFMLFFTALNNWSSSAFI